MAEQTRLKDHGTCLRIKDGRQINRSKFKTEMDALDALDFHKNLGVIKDSDTIYKCKECHMYHMGDPERDI
jgi:hypothetical protein